MGNALPRNEPSPFDRLARTVYSPGARWLPLNTVPAKTSPTPSSGPAAFPLIPNTRNHFLFRASPLRTGSVLAFLSVPTVGGARRIDFQRRSRERTLSDTRPIGSARF